MLLARMVIGKAPFKLRWIEMNSESYISNIILWFEQKWYPDFKNGLRVMFRLSFSMSSFIYKLELLMPCLKNGLVLQKPTRYKTRNSTFFISSQLAVKWSIPSNLLVWVGILLRTGISYLIDSIGTFEILRGGMSATPKLLVQEDGAI